MEREFFLRAMDVMRDSRWARYSRSPTVRLRAVADLTAAYTDLLAWAFVEYVDRLARLITAAKMRIAWSKIEENAFQFVGRFVSGLYRHPWTGYFLQSQEWIEPASANAAFVTLHASGPWFDITVVTPDHWERIFEHGVRSGSWRQRAIEIAKNRVDVIAMSTPRPAAPARRRRTTPINPAKILFAAMKVKFPGISIKRLCEIADAKSISPLKSWGKPTWIAAWRAPQTRGRVKAYVSKR
jgi:hypothetical protein